MLSDNASYEPLKKKITDVREEIRDEITHLRENIVSQFSPQEISESPNATNMHRDGLVDWMKGLGKNISGNILHTVDNIGSNRLDQSQFTADATNQVNSVEKPVQYAPPIVSIEKVTHQQESNTFGKFGIPKNFLL